MVEGGEEVILLQRGHRQDRQILIAAHKPFPPGRGHNVRVYSVACFLFCSAPLEPSPWSMHESLHAANLTGLPPWLEVIAQSALRGSSRDLEYLSLAVEIQDLPASQAILVLPAFFANLDPTLVPRQEAEAPSAVQALRGLHASRRVLPVGAFVDVWPRYWAWVVFFLRHQQDQSRMVLMLHDLLAFVAVVTSDDACLGLMGRTTGLRYWISRAWRSIARGGHPDAVARGIRCLSVCLSKRQLCAEGSESLEEYIDGAGGSRAKLAQIVIASLNHVLRDSCGDDTSGLPTRMEILQCLLHFVMLTDQPYYIREEGENDPIGAMFLLHGLIDTLPSVLHRAAKIPFPDSEHSIRLVFVILGAAFRRPEWLRWLVAALDSGLLRVAVACGSRHPSSVAHSEIERICLMILPVSLMYISGVEAFHRAVEGVTRWDSSLAVSRVLIPVSAIAHERLLISRSVADPDFEYKTACDNIECGKIQPKRQLKRCAACHSAYYCDTSCQGVDWKAGGHRTICGPGRSLSLSDLSGVTWRQRAYLRALLRSDYLRNIRAVCDAQLRVMHRLKDVRQPICTVLDYTSGYPKMEVIPACSHPFAELFGREWEHAVSRTQRSGGRIQIHVVKLEDDHCWLLPLRHPTSHIFDTLNGILHNAPVDILDAMLNRLHEWIEESQHHLDGVY
ncbi:hypothetical protein C8R43DRAFT_1118434 [Mycena crocata]|nr:hypothetical protein C8R43DRAFT_1118434 [Mycena crocata]